MARVDSNLALVGWCILVCVVPDPGSRNDPENTSTQYDSSVIPVIPVIPVLFVLFLHPPHHQRVRDSAPGTDYCTSILHAV